MEADVVALKPDIQQLFYLFKGYGYMIKRRFKLAHEAYTKAEAVIALDSTGKFNKVICEGVMKLKEKDWTSALNLFSKTAELLPKKKITAIYQFTTYTSLYFHLRLCLLLTVEMRRIFRRQKIT